MQVRERHRLRRSLYWLVDHPWYVLLLVGVIGVTKWIIDTRSEPYIVRASFRNAFNLVPGLPVDIHGLQVGMITGVTYDHADLGGGHAIVSIGISDSSFIPLHRGTVVESRWGSTIGNGTRRLDVSPGPANAPAIPNQGIIDTSSTIPAQDVDQQLNIFTHTTRGHLTHLLGELRGGFQGQAPALRGGLNSAPAALSAANGIFSDLNLDSYALQQLIASADRVTGTLAVRAAAVNRVVTDAASTFDAMAQHASQLQQSITDLPGALTSARSTLARLDTTVGTVNGLIDDIRPGAAQLAPLATELDPTLASLRRLVPTALATVRTATAQAPSITHLLGVATPFLPKVRSVTSQLAPMVACMRPYAPEAATAVTDLNLWINTYILEKPNQGLVTFIGKRNGPYVEQHGVRAMPEADTESFHDYPINSQQFVQATGKQYDYIRPPGFVVQQPWYQPQCGITPAVLNPANDPEAAR